MRVERLDRFGHRPDEVKRHIRSGLFWLNYTHVSGSYNRAGIGHTGKLLSGSLARYAGFTPFSGEMHPYTFLLRLYYISVSGFPPHEHEWYSYTHHGTTRWSPETSQEFIQFLQDEIKRQRAREEKPDLPVFLDPALVPDIIMKLEANIEFELERQRVYAAMPPEERARMAASRPEIYAFRDLPVSCTDMLFGGAKKYKLEHPVVPGEINLQRYLLGMFTQPDAVEETHAWISRLLGREVPVASIDALATWERMLPELPVYKERGYPNPHSFYCDLNADAALRERVIRETLNHPA